MPIKAICCKGGFSDATLYKWRARFGGVDVPDARRLRELEGENAKLKKLLAAALMDRLGSGTVIALGGAVLFVAGAFFAHQLKHRERLTQA